MLDRLSKQILLGSCALVVVLCGWALTDYSYRPGARGDVRTKRPSCEMDPYLLTDEFVASSEPTQLLLFYHPHCPCTNSVVRILARLSVNFTGDVQVVAFGFCPGKEADSWISSRTTSALKQISAKVIVDRNAEYCSKFGVKTSGHILLYGSNGDLLFSGGITPGRGHEGSSPSSADLLKKVNGQLSESRDWPVFGCPIIATTSL